MSQDITVTDLFCGAGGSSIGAEAAGARLRMAANHWPLAIETHNTNFPNADHDCADVSQVDPRRYPKTDVLIASPECTEHSQAKSHKSERTIWDQNGVDAAERSRATMWDVPRFAEYHRYALVVVENVVEARRWSPFPYWLGAMESLGYEHRAVYLNSMIAHPTPQSRDRMYVVFWRKGNPAPDLDFNPISWCASCETDVYAVQSWKNPVRPWGKYRSQYVYRCPSCMNVALPYAWPAASAIDWSIPAPRIGDRVRPLAPATIARIEAGLRKYGPGAIVQAAGNTFERPGYYRTWPWWQPLKTQTTTIQHGVVMTYGYDNAPRSTEDVMRSITSEHDQALVVTMRGTSDAALENTARPSSDPLGPVTAGGPHAALVVGINYSHARPEGQVRSSDEPMSTQTAQQAHGLVVPAGGTWNDDARLTDEPFRTRTGNESEGLIVPLRTHGKAEPAEVSPIPTIVAGNAGHGLLIRQYGQQGGRPERMSRSTTEPAATLTAGDSTYLLTRAFTGGAEMTKPIEAPTGAITARDHHELIKLPFLASYHRMGGQLSHVEEPHRTVDTRDRTALVIPEIPIEDCGFRMLEPAEIGRAMAFSDSYKVLGTKRDQVRQYGNAVTPPVMSLILSRSIATLKPEMP